MYKIKFTTIAFLLLINVNKVTSMEMETELDQNQNASTIVASTKRARTKIHGRVEKCNLIKSDLIKLFVLKKLERCSQSSDEKKEEIIVEKVLSSKKKFSCRYCASGYQYSSYNLCNVKRHEKHHKNSGSYSCECGCKFKHLGALNKHRLHSHKEN